MKCLYIKKVLNLLLSKIHSYYKGAPKKKREGNMVDVNLIKRCQTGDAESIGELYKAYRGNALGTAYLISDHKGIAEDIVQEAFIHCFADIKKIKNPETFDIWFYKILVRTGWRMVKKYNHYIPESDENIENFSSSNNSNPVFDDCETIITVSEALEKLSMPLKTVIILYYFNDMSIKEISEVLGCFQGTVKSRLHNAKKQLYYELYGTFHEDEEHNFKSVLCKREGLEIHEKHV